MEDKRKRGRPKIPNSRNELVNFRVNEEESSMLKALVYDMGMTKADVLRALIRQKWSSI